MVTIDTDYVYKKLKKQNGEGVARVIRSAGLLEIPNIVHILEFAGSDPDEIKQLLPLIQRKYIKIPEKIENEPVKTPFELLKEAGYDAFEVKTLEQQNSIKKYFRPDEKICTFHDPHRYKDYHIIHAIKHNADKIKPFDVPKREDEYGTSVISIQIAKHGGSISIKNRYNHTVDCPDATFKNNPDNIIKGLTNSLNKYFSVNISVSDIPEHFHKIHDQFLRYDYEFENCYFGVDYYTDHDYIVKIDKDHEIMFDFMVLNLMTGELNNPCGIYRGDAAYKLLQKLFKGKKIRIQINRNNKKQKFISVNNMHVATIENCHIVELTLPKFDTIDSNFGTILYEIKEVNLPDTDIIGDNFFSETRWDSLEILNMPKVQYVGDSFLFANRDLRIWNAPKLVKIGSQPLNYNHALKSLYLPEYIGSETLLYNNKNLTSVYVPKLKEHNPKEYERLQSIVEKNKKAQTAIQSIEKVKGV